MTAPRTPDVSIISTAHDVADARLHRISAALNRAGLQVEVIGLGRADDGPPGTEVHVAVRRGPFRRAVEAMRLPWRARARVVLTLDPDVAFGAWVLRQVHGRRRRAFVADVHEDYLAVLGDRRWASGGKAMLARAWAHLGRFAATRGDLTVVADAHLLPHAPRRIVVRNLPDLGMLPAPAPKDETPRAVYIGDLRASRGLFDMLDAVRDAPAWTLDLVGPVAENDADRLTRTLAADPVLAGRVRLHGRQPPERAWRHAAGAWVGMLLLSDTPAFRDAVPSKLYEYVATGLAVLSTPLPRCRELLAAWGNGAVVTDASEAAAQLRAWHADPSSIDTARAAARTAAATVSGTSDLDQLTERIRPFLTEVT